MRRALFIKIQVLLVLLAAAICQGQLLMGTPLGKEFDSSLTDGEISEEDLQKVMEMQLVEEEIESSLNNAEGILEGLQSKAEPNNGQTTDDEMFSAIKKSIEDISRDNEEDKNRDISIDIKLAKNLIRESALEEIQEELRENLFFTDEKKDETDQSKSQIRKRKSDIINRKKELYDMINKEKSQLKSDRNKMKTMDNMVPSDDNVFEKQAEAKKKQQDSFVKSQKKQAAKLEALINNNSGIPTIFNVEDTEDIAPEENEKSFLQDTLDSILGDDLDFEFNESNQADIINDDGRRIQDLQDTFIDEEGEKLLEKNIEELIFNGEELHEQFLEEQEVIEALLGNKDEDNKQETEQKQVYDVEKIGSEVYESKMAEFQKKIQQEETKDVLSDIDKKKKEEEEEEKSTFYKQIAFSIVIVLAIIFMAFGFQFDIFSFFNQQRRSKDPFYRDDEAQQSLIH